MILVAHAILRAPFQSLLPLALLLLLLALLLLFIFLLSVRVDNAGRSLLSRRFTFSQCSLQLAL